MNCKKLAITYLGKRDYIDVSTLSSALYQALPDVTDNSKIKNLNIRLIKKVVFECELKLTDLTEKVDKLKTAVVFDWEYEGKLFVAHFVETSKEISDRRSELVDDPSDLMRYQDGEVILFNPINDDCIYNLMKMGRLIVVNKYNLYPRVVRFHFDELFNCEEMKGIIMKAEPYSGKDFYKLETFKDGKKFGEIIIKGLEPY